VAYDELQPVMLRDLRYDFLWQRGEDGIPAIVDVAPRWLCALANRPCRIRDGAGRRARTRSL